MRTALALVVIAAAAFAQQDMTTDGSVGRSSVLLSHGKLPAADEVHVYDFINYHRHALPEPTATQAVALDARLLNVELPERDGETVLQLGFRTHRLSMKELAPANLCIVIDKSGSMADAHKLEYVKAALERFLGAFTEAHIVSIVAFDDDAVVVREPARVSDAKALVAAVKDLAPGSGTNLHDGLMLGFESAAKNLDPKRANRVILLSDGMANHGITDAAEILKDVKTWTDKGIDLTTVGIGLDYNNALMRSLAEAGRGTYHYLDSGEEVERVFGTFLQALVEKAARSPRVTLTLGDGVEVRQVHGYDFKRDGRTLTFELLDMPLSLTQVIPIEISVTAGAKSIGTVKLTYRDDRRQANAETEREIPVKRGSSAVDEDVRKNITIARLATASRQACEKRDKDALALVKAALEACDRHYTRELKDPDVDRVAKLARGIVELLEK